MKSIIFLVFSASLAAFVGATPACAEMATNNPAGSEGVRVEQSQANSAAVLQLGLNLERQLARGGPSDEELTRAIAEAQDAHKKKLEQIERLTRQLADLKAALLASQTAEANIEEQIREWESKLAAAKAQLEELAKREAELMRLLADNGKTSGLARGMDAGDRKALIIMINHNLVAPLKQPYFQGRRLHWVNGDSGLEITANQDGVTLGASLEEGGWLADDLASATPDQTYAAVFVAPDSIGTYYALLKEIRRRKLLQTWTTWDGTSFKVNTSRKSSKATVY